ncbi:MAG: C25 family cysteine peptidase [Bacteroidales bacterium]
MKKINLIMILLISSVYCFADYSDSVRTNLSDLSFSTQEGYDVIQLKNASYINQIGAPQLPIKIIRILIPIDKKVDSISIDSVNVQQLNGKYNLYPVQTPVPINISLESVPFDNPDTSIYNNNTPYPATKYSITNDGYPMGYHVITITFYPLEYIPSDSIVNLYSSIYFTLHYINNNDKILRPFMQSKFSNELSKTYLKNLVSNYNDIYTISGGGPLEVINNGTPVPNLQSISLSPALIHIPDYIIITNDSLKESFQRLADWKTQKGIYTIVTSVEDIYSIYQGYDNAEKIRNYLKDVYINYGSSFVLMGGDAEIIPVRFSMINLELYECDFYYATVQGNWNANGDNIFGDINDNTDISPVFYVGRAPVHNNAEVNVFINKVIGYEKLNNTPNKSYVQNLSFWAGDGAKSGNCGDYPWHIERLNTIDSSINAYLDPEQYFILKLYDHYNEKVWDKNKKDSVSYIDSQYIDRYYQLNKLNVVEAMNQGWWNFNHNYGKIHLIYHCDHSGFNVMGTSSHCLNECIFTSDMYNLLNGIEYSQILYSDGCQTSRFSKDAIPEEYLNNPNGGGVAFLGNICNGYWGEDTFFVNYFINELYDLTKLEAFRNEHYYLGNLNSISTFNGNSTRLKKRILFGDPSMMVWSATPTNLTVSNIAYSSNNKEITGTISGLSFNTTSHIIVTVCAWKDSEIYCIEEIDASTSNVNFVLSNVVADTPGDIIVTVTAHNYIPHIDTIHVSSINGAHPYVTLNFIFDYLTGNNNGTADAGETVELHILLTNSGNLTASNVTAELLWEASAYQNVNMINIFSPTANFGTLSAGGSSSRHFVFSIDKDAFENMSLHPLTQNAVFLLNIYINGIYYSTKTLNIQINESHLKKGENMLTGTLLSGSSNQLKIKLYNIGLTEAVGLSGELQAVLTTNNPDNITITTETSTYNNINGVNIQPNYVENNTFFEFTVDNQDYSNETFNLLVTDKYGKTWIFDNFNLSKTLNCYAEISHKGYENSISLSFPFYEIIGSEEISYISLVHENGYNLYRSTNVDGPCVKINENIIPYSTFLDENLEPLTYYYYKITFINYNGNESDFFPDTGYLASTTLSMHTGWPIRPYPKVNFLGNEAKGSPNVFDVNGDNKKEIFFTTGSIGNPEGGVWAFEHDGTRWYMLDNQPGSVSGFIDLNCYTSSTPAIADIDNDGVAEIGITTHPIDASTNSQKLLVYKTTIDNNNDSLPDKQFTNKSISGWENNKGPIFSDINNNGTYEILVNNQQDNNYVGINIFKKNGYVHNGWLQSSQDTFGMCGFSMPVAFDFDNDNSKEIVIGCTKYGSRNAGIYIYREDGTNFGQSNPVYLPQDTSFRCDVPPIIADIDNDGTFEILFIAAKKKTANIYAMKSDGTPISGWNWNNNHPSFTLSNSVSEDGNPYYGQFCPSFSVSDLNKDGNLEVICGDKGHVYIWSHNGNPIKDIHIHGYTSQTNKVPIIADIDEDDSDLEIIVTSTFITPNDRTNIYAYKMDGTIVKGFPITIHTLVENSPCVDDIDNDGMNELIVTTGMEFYVWDTYGNVNNNVYGWKSYRRDNLNSGIFFKETCNYSNSPIHITSNQEWNKFKLINQNVIINSSAILTISKEVRFTSNAQIIIQPGGKLILDGGTLTNACDGKLWQGIFVEGNLSDPTQHESMQGVVELINGAVIENAVCAINVGYRLLGVNPVMCFSGGGIVKASNASFINNLQAVEFGPYDRYLQVGLTVNRNNTSWFENCDFTINSNALFNINEFKEHVKLIGVRGIAFEGCSFNGMNYMGTAIYSSSSGFRLGYQLIFNPNQDRNHFSNFNIAINIEDGGTKAISIYNSDFHNNNICIRAEGASELYIRGNTLNIPYSPYYGPTTGISLTNCSRFYIDNNTFHGVWQCNYGLIIHHSEANNNIVKNNTFSFLNTACLAYGKNSDGANVINGYKGLQYHCNWYEENGKDIVVEDYEGINGNIRFVQGEADKASGNIFSPNGTNLYSPNYDFQYFYKNHFYRHRPFNSSPNIYLRPKYFDVCNSQIGVINPNIAPYDPPTNWNDELTTQYNQINNMLLPLKDHYISMGYNQFPIDWQMYFYGGYIPPHLEEQVNLYYAINDLENELSEVCKQAVYYVHSDELFDFEAYHSWLTRIHSPEADYLLAESYYEREQYGECFDVLNNIPTQYETFNDIEHQNYLLFYNLKEQLRGSGQTWSDISEGSVEYQQLNAIAVSGINGAAFKARAILSAYFNQDYPPVILEPPLLDLCWYIANLTGDGTSGEEGEEVGITMQKNDTSKLSLRPNPALDELTIDNGINNIQEVSIFDVLGKELKRYSVNNSKITLNISDLSSGIYILKASTQKGIHIKKFVKE